MRALALLTLTALPVVSGCSSDCGPHDQFNSFTWRVFANPVVFESTNPAFTAGPDYWSYGSPANGVSEWQFQWGAAPVGPVTVVIDGQSFEGTGDMDDTECGYALVTFGGTYLDSLNDVEHNFNASLSMNLWSDALGAQLGAFMIWKESWSHPSSESGTFNVDAHLTGELVSQGT